jgi:hypothetical protein
MEMRWIQCQELVFFYLAIIFLAIGGAGTSSQLMNATDSLFVGDSNESNPADTPAITNGGGDGTVDVVVQNWRGFATKDDESHAIRLNVETIRTLGPDDARRLLASNISIEEVRSQTRAEDRDTISRGNIWLNNDGYWLIDITMMSSADRSTLKASVASPRSGSGSIDAASTVGRVVVTISMVDSIPVAKGYMVINDSKYHGTYNLSLNESLGRGPRGRGPRAGMMGWR